MCSRPCPFLLIFVVNNIVYLSNSKFFDVCRSFLDVMNCRFRRSLMEEEAAVPKKPRLQPAEAPRLSSNAASIFAEHYLLHLSHMVGRPFPEVEMTRALRLVAISKPFAEATQQTHKNQIVVLAFHSDRVGVISVAARRQVISEIPLKYQLQGVEATKRFLTLVFPKQMDVAIIFCNEGSEFSPKEFTNMTRFLMNTFTGRFLWTCGRQVHSRHKRNWAAALAVLEILRTRLYIAYGPFHALPFLENCKFHQLIISNVHRGMHLEGLDEVAVDELTFEGTSDFLRYLHAPLPGVKSLSFWLGPWDSMPRTPYMEVFRRIPEYFPDLEVVKMNDRCFLDSFQPSHRRIAWKWDEGYEVLRRNVRNLQNVFQCVKGELRNGF
uniref:Uncharacterized protein n=1 Tax=Bursaphelenchus xylophilus TaxID=6326 RepID=A0A1I7RM67_BURXY